MSSNSNQKLITAVSIIVALAAVVYAMTVQMQSPNRMANGAANGGATTAQTADRERGYEPGEENPVVLTIDGRDVTRMEVMDTFADSGSQLPEGAQMGQVFPLLQEQYLITFMLNDAARKEGIDGTNPEVAARIEEAREQAIRAVFLDNIAEESITENDVRNTYDELIANSEPIVERRARHILVETEEEANNLIQQLNEGADFEELAREHSTGPTGENGGDLGFFAPNEMVPAFAQAAFSMPVGATSDEPVETQFGFHVIKVEDERSREKPSFEDMRGQIEQQLRQAVIREKVQEIRENMDVVVYDFEGNPVEMEQQDGEEAETTGGDESAPADQEPENEAAADQNEE